MGNKTSRFHNFIQKYSAPFRKKSSKTPKRKRSEHSLLNKHIHVLLYRLNKCTPISRADHAFQKALENDQIKTKSDFIKYFKLHDIQSKNDSKKNDSKKEEQSPFTNTLHDIAKKINLEKAPPKLHEKNRHNWSIRKLLSSIANSIRKRLKSDTPSPVKTASSKETTQPKVDLNTAKMTETEKAEVTAAKKKLEEECNDLKSLLLDIDKLSDKVRVYMEKRQNK